MVCLRCQNNMNSQERFCSKCGSDSSLDRIQPLVQPRPRNWDTHVSVLAWIFIVSALLMVVPGFFLMLFPGMMQFGMAHRPFHFAGPVFFMIGLVFISIPAGTFAAGIGLLKRREWARVLSLVLASFMLILFPFGTAFGIYCYWVLLSREGSASYRRGPSPEGRKWTQSNAAAPGER